jgi:hypothetical protein
MNRMIVRSRVDADGVLRVTVPVGTAEADREVQLTIEPMLSPAMNQAEWQEFVRSTAGSITDPTFVRHEQGAYERREELP